MQRNLYLNTMPVDQAKAIYMEALRDILRPHPEAIRVTDALGRVTAEAVYAFKDAMDDLSAGEDGERLFGTVNLNGPSASKGGQRFDLDCQYQKEGEE